MDSFEWNKIFGALLAGAFVVLGLNFLADGIYSSHAPEQAGYAIAGADPVAPVGGGKKEVVIEAIAPLLASADIEAGLKVAKKCVACHNFEEGAKNKVGPVLWNKINAQIAKIEGFNYSNALKEFGEGKVWDYDTMNKFLYKPKDLVKGTSMGFAGLKKVEERANLIAYMRSLSNDPAPLPDPAAAVEAEAEPEETDSSTN